MSDDTASAPTSASAATSAVASRLLADAPEGLREALDALALLAPEQLSRITSECIAYIAYRRPALPQPDAHPSHGAATGMAMATASGTRAQPSVGGGIRALIYVLRRAATPPDGDGKPLSAKALGKVCAVAAAASPGTEPTLPMQLPLSLSSPRPALPRTIIIAIPTATSPTLLTNVASIVRPHTDRSPCRHACDTAILRAACLSISGGAAATATRWLRSCIVWRCTDAWLHCLLRWLRSFYCNARLCLKTALPSSRKSGKRRYCVRAHANIGWPARASRDRSTSALTWGTAERPAVVVRCTEAFAQCRSGTSVGGRNGTGNAAAVALPCLYCDGYAIIIANPSICARRRAGSLSCGACTVCRGRDIVAIAAICCASLDRVHMHCILRMA